MPTAHYPIDDRQQSVASNYGYTHGFDAEGRRSFKAFYMLKAGQLLDVLYDKDSHFTIYLVGNKTPNLSDVSIGAKMCASLLHQQPKDGNSVPLLCSKRKISKLGFTKWPESDSQTKETEHSKCNGNASASEIPTDMESNTGDDSCDEDYATMYKSNNSHNYLETVQIGGLFTPHCYVVMQRSYLTGRYNLSIPMGFAEAVLHSGVNERRLRLKGKGVWVVTCRRWKDKARITSGWEDFSKVNKLGVYDVVAIERNTKDANIWNLTIFRNWQSRKRCPR